MTPLDYPEPDPYTSTERIDMHLTMTTLARQWLDGEQATVDVRLRALCEKYGHPVLISMMSGWATMRASLGDRPPAPPPGETARAYAVNLLLFAVEMQVRPQPWHGAALMALGRTMVATWELAYGIAHVLLDLFATHPDRAKALACLDDTEARIVKFAPLMHAQEE